MPLAFDSFEVCTFDCYGTLIDWESGILHAVRPVLQRGANPLTDSQILKLYADLEAQAEAPPHRLYRDVLAEVMRGLAARAQLSLAAGEEDLIADSVQYWQPFPDTVNALQRMASRYRLAVISNIDDDLFAATRRKLMVEFADVITAQQVGSYKPSLNNFQHALRRLKVSPGRQLHIAQSLFHDIAPTRKLGIANVWVNRHAGCDAATAVKAAAVEADLTVNDLATLAGRMGV